MGIEGILLLSFAVPFVPILIGLGIWLWQAHRPGRRPRTPLAVVLSGTAIPVLILFLSFAFSGSINLLIEWINGETPQAKVAAYLEALAQGDKEAALEMWHVKGGLGPDYEERRGTITGELLALGGDLTYRILDVEWWSTCCDPSITWDPRQAGFARMKVAVGDAIYIFDVKAVGGGYWREMEGYPVRGWRIVDVYHEGKAHLAWPWPLPTPTPGPPPRKLIVEDVAVRMRPGIIELEGRIDLPPGTELMAVLQRDGKDWYWAEPDARRTTVGEDGRFAFIIRAAPDQPDTLPPANYVAFIFPTDPALRPFIPAHIEWDTYGPPSNEQNETADEEGNALRF